MTTISPHTREELGASIARLRADLGVSQSVLANDIGISARALCSIENGQADIALDVLIVLAKKLGVDLNYLAGIDVDNIRQLFGVHGISLALWRKYSEFNPLYKQKIAREIQFLYAQQSRMVAPPMFTFGTP